MPNWTYRPIGLDEDEFIELTLIRPLHLEGASPLGWMDRIGRSGFRVLLDGEQPVAGCGLAHMGMWFGGRSVPTACFNGVGVVPAARGIGAGRALMAAALHELAAARTPLATLYPATLQFYEKFGFAQAGRRQSFELPLSLITHGPTDATLEPLLHPERERLAAIRTEFSRRTNGQLDRPPWMWTTRIEPKGICYRYVVREQHRDTGYIVYTQGSRGEPLTIVDSCCLTISAARALLRLLAGYRTMVEQMNWVGGPTDLLLLALSEQIVAGDANRVHLRRDWEWMLRIVDLPAALAARGYPAGLDLAVDLEVHDELLPENAGRWRVTIGATGAHAARGGDGRITIDIRGLTALYSAYRHPTTLQALGLIDGPAEELALLGAAFSGPQPWMNDMF